MEKIALSPINSGQLIFTPAFPALSVLFSVEWNSRCASCKNYINCGDEKTTFALREFDVGTVQSVKEIFTPPDAVSGIRIVDCVLLRTIRISFCSSFVRLSKWCSE